MPHSLEAIVRRQGSCISRGFGDFELVFFCLSGRASVGWEAEIELLASMMYRLSTIGLGNQTLGEELCELFPLVFPSNIPPRNTLSSASSSASSSSSSS